ncbi:hypothetical protein D3C75_950190 [compost metagenome]
MGPSPAVHLVLPINLTFKLEQAHVGSKPLENFQHPHINRRLQLILQLAGALRILLEQQLGPFIFILKTLKLLFNHSVVLLCSRINSGFATGKIKLAFPLIPFCTQLG